MRIRCVYDVIVEDEQYLDKIDWKDVREIISTSLEHVAMKKYDIVVKGVEPIGEHIHDTRRSHCATDYELAEDGKY